MEYERPCTGSQNIILIFDYTIMVMGPHSTRGFLLICIINGINETIVCKNYIVSVIVVDGLPGFFNQFFQYLFGKQRFREI